VNVERGHSTQLDRVVPRRVGAEGGGLDFTRVCEANKRAREVDMEPRR
jgi:hypothetical protein